MTGPQLFGWLDPTGRLSAPLADWARGRGAHCAATDGAFQLWLWPGSATQVIATDRRVAAVFGGLFGEPDEQATRHIAAASPARLAELEGRFIRVLWEGNERRLSLFRDDSSSLTLYYRTQPGGALVFSDDLDLLVDSPAADRRIGRASLHEYLRFLDISTPHTIYEGVRSVEPGVDLECPAGDEPVARPVASAPTPEVPDNLEDAATELDRLLVQAVAKRIPERGDLIAFLSGGVDSALIAAVAGQVAPGRVQAFTVGFAEAGFDEAPVATAIAHHLGLPHRVLRLPPSSYRAAFDAWTGGMAYPYADPAGLPTLLGYQDAMQIAPVALDGTGADTLVGIMPARHCRLAARWGTLLPRPVRRALAAALAALGDPGGMKALVDFDDPQDLLIRWRGWPRREIERLCDEPVSLEHTRFYRLYREYASHQHFERYSRVMGNLPDDRVHECSRLTDLEVRFPFFDRDLVAFVRALPRDLRYREDEPKRILKAVLKRRVPRAIWDLPKHGFDFPFADFLTADDHALTRDYLAPERVRALGLVDPELVAATLARFRTGDRGLAFRVWALTVLFAWIENHRPPQAPSLR